MVGVMDPSNPRDFAVLMMSIVELMGLTGAPPSEMLAAREQAHFALKYETALYQFDLRRAAGDVVNATTGAMCFERSEP